MSNDFLLFVGNRRGESTSGAWVKFGETMLSRAKVPIQHAVDVRSKLT